MKRRTFLHCAALGTLAFPSFGWADRNVKPYYDDGKGIVIYHGDCREVLPMLAAESVDLVLTDPPYGHNNNNNGDLIHRREAALGRLPSGDDRQGDAAAHAGPPADQPGGPGRRG